MTIEEIDLYKLKEEDLMRYLPDIDTPSCGGSPRADLARALVAGKMKAVECGAIDRKLAEVMDAVLGIDIHLPESDPMQQKVPERLFEYNSPDASSPVIITGNSVITHQILKLIFEASKIKAFVMPVDTNGFTLDNAVVEGVLTPLAVMKAITDSGIAAKTSGRRAVISDLAKGQKSGIERITRWTLEVGPVSGFELPLYLLGR
jgi:acetyl-CoA decarbonylase/synthase complex subunit gamma